MASAPQDKNLSILMPGVSDKEERRTIALEARRRHLSRAHAFMAALDQEAKTPFGLEVYLIAGDASNTPSRVSVNRNNGQLQVMEYAPGDGKRSTR